MVLMFAGMMSMFADVAPTFAGMVLMYAERLNWTSLSLIMAHFAERVNFGVQSELLQLIEIPEVQARA